ncbi:Dfp1/Him1, central region-domain-containing protein [Parachaetomium inaequale]|uniref:Dfp1/Him1, central region-domain-containing protein n=1 Tax=Parachaetomium inaequale TaxID=2588326 RepID=A0AAN6SUC0_9PEZI|nr:Dfp1/Him1, central region-domain-containing protein [Parachaetomium inaequale]
MSTKRIPLSTSNPNVANSPMRAHSALNGAKKVRSHADSAREEAYGQPPPAKRQMIDRGVPSPSRAKATRTIVHRSASRATASTAATHKPAGASAYKPTEEEMVNLRTWHTQIRSRFPKMVFYFESISDEQRSKLAKQVGRLGAREEKFFSINITHIVTTRPIPPEKPKHEGEGADTQGDNEQPKTINPSLLNRAADPTRRKLVYDTAAGRKPPVPNQEDPLRRPKTRSTDVLDRARDMGKKIWSLEKLNKILDIALHPDPYISAALSRGSTQSTSKTANEQAHLAQLLDNERLHGPSDRDPTVSSKDLYPWRGPYIYVYDVEEKTKPIMVREYAKASDPKDQDWPQFRIASQGRCPFILDENYDLPDKENRDRDQDQTRIKSRAAKIAAEKAAELAAPKPKTSEFPLKATTGKRTLTQMEDGHNRGIVGARATTESFDRSKVSNPPTLEFRSQNAFISHAKAGRFLAGEPVASGLQPSNVTSAIRSQMISSTTGGVLGAKAGTSKEIHGLQRKVVLQKASTPAVSQDLSSRRMTEMSHDSNTFVRSASVSQATQRKLDPVDEEGTSRQREKLRRTASVPVSQPKPKRDPKPGYCENCQDKFADFEEHIVSRKHRKFAENNDNWAQLDDLLSQLTRGPRY